MEKSADSIILSILFCFGNREQSKFKKMADNSVESLYFDIHVYILRKMWSRSHLRWSAKTFHRKSAYPRAQWIYVVFFHLSRTWCLQTNNTDTSELSFSCPIATSSPTKVTPGRSDLPLRVLVLNCQSIKTPGKPAQLQNIESRRLISYGFGCACNLLTSSSTRGYLAFAITFRYQYCFFQRLL